jgi:hypothetical protein
VRCVVCGLLGPGSWVLGAAACWRACLMACLPLLLSTHTAEIDQAAAGPLPTAVYQQPYSVPVFMIHDSDHASQRRLMMRELGHSRIIAPGSLHAPAAAAADVTTTRILVVAPACRDQQAAAAGRRQLAASGPQAAVTLCWRSWCLDIYCAALLDIHENRQNWDALGWLFPAAHSQP